MKKAHVRLSDQKQLSELLQKGTFQDIPRTVLLELDKGQTYTSVKSVVQLH